MRWHRILMTIWDNISRFKFIFHKARIVSRFVNEFKNKYVNKEEMRLTPIAFYRNERDKEEISVFCVDKYIKNLKRQHNKIWEMGDRTFAKAHHKEAVARGDVLVKDLERIYCDKDKKKNLFIVPSWFNEHCNIKPTVEDFHDEDVRVAKLADASHLIKRQAV